MITFGPGMNDHDYPLIPLIGREEKFLIWNKKRYIIVSLFFFVTHKSNAELQWCITLQAHQARASSGKFLGTANQE